jgi:hypothetical protein
MSHDLHCWKCGVSLADYSLPLRRIEECRTCHAELHVCRMCQFYDTAGPRAVASRLPKRSRTGARQFLRLLPAVVDGVPSGRSHGRRTRTAELEALFGRK